MKLIKLLQQYAKDIRKERNDKSVGSSADDQEAKEERAAIMEYDGGLERKKAEELARTNN